MTADVIEFQPWKRLIRKRSGSDGQPEIIPTLAAVAAILTFDESWRGCLRRDTFADVIEVVKPLPRCESIAAPPIGPLSDDHGRYIRVALGEIHRCVAPKQTVDDAICLAATQNERHPLRDYLAAARWDAVNRLDTWLCQYLGAADTPYVRAVGRWFLISAIARAMRPGCKADHVLVLEGPQGSAKSSAIQILGGPFYLPKLPNLRDYDRAALGIQGHWIVEIGELDALRGANETLVKEFLTLRQDHYRSPYARNYVTRSRACVFVATTNEENYLRDPTGARRFWPVRIGASQSIDRRALAADRDQIFAEAMLAFEAGESFEDIDRPAHTRWWPSSDTDSIATGDAIVDEQRARNDVAIDAWLPVVAAWLDAIDRDTGKRRESATTGETLVAIGLETGKHDNASAQRAAAILRRCGFTDRRQQRQNGVRSWRYYRDDSPVTG